MTSKKSVLTKKYIEFQNEISKVIDTDIFPSLEDIDIVDMLVIFDMNFGTTHSDDEMINAIDLLIDVRGLFISDNDRVLIYPIAIKFIRWLKKFNSDN